jgi:hypothetical protein
MRNRQRGAAALELALTLPSLVLLLAGGVELGLALFAKHELGQAASVVAHRCVAFRDTIGTVNACPVASTIEADVLPGTAASRLCSDVRTDSLSNVPLGPGRRHALELELSCAFRGGPLLSTLARFGVSMPRLHAAVAVAY